MTVCMYAHEGGIWVTRVGHSPALSIATQIGFISGYRYSGLVGTVDLWSTLYKAYRRIAKSRQLEGRACPREEDSRRWPDTVPEVL